MPEQELLFLGLLMAGPKHGYEIKRLLQKELLPYFGLDLKSIYYPLKKMQASGLLTKHRLQAGRRPLRYVYQLTEKGRARFRQALKENFLTIQRPYFNLDLSLYFLPFISPQMSRRLLRARIRFLKKIENGLKKLARENACTSPSSLIIQHDRELIQTEIVSLTRLYSKL
jgi:DNA-binding PadR family transcriptional regulator